MQPACALRLLPAACCAYGLAAMLMLMQRVCLGVLRVLATSGEGERHLDKRISYKDIPHQIIYNMLHLRSPEMQPLFHNGCNAARYTLLYLYIPPHLN